MARRFRRHRGKFGYYRRGRWHWRHRLRRRRYSRRRKLRYARRRPSARSVKRKIFNPHPGSYLVRLPNPYNAINLYFQGLVFIPRATSYLPDTTKGKNVTTTNVALINVNLKEFFWATLPLDARSKIGGPNPFPQHIQGCDWAGIATTHKGTWPYSTQMSSARQPGAWPSEWWRWALLLMHPRSNVRFFGSPKLMTLSQIGQFLGGWQLFTHRFTKFRVLATKSRESFSPVASLLVQDNYFARREGAGPPISGQPPMCTMQRLTRDYSGTESNAPANETTIPSMPPDPPQYPVQTGCSTSADPGEYLLAGLTRTAVSCWYSRSTYPSFATLSALGAPWSFPAGQKSISKTSFNKHVIRGMGDPQGKKWLTLVPKGQEWINADSMTKSELDTDIATLYLAQGTSRANSYKFNTFHEVMVQDPMNVAPWAVVKVSSVWTLGNNRRPYPWDVNWYNEFTAEGRVPAD
nr:VP1 [Gyrovirus GyV3]WNA12400.1 VP1 [Gyrovirus GyV3]